MYKPPPVKENCFPVPTLKPWLGSGERGAPLSVPAWEWGVVIGKKREKRSEKRVEFIGRRWISG